MGYEIFDGDYKNYVLVDKKSNDKQVELIKLSSEKAIKTKKSNKKLSAKNKEFINSLKTGHGFKIISKP